MSDKQAILDTVKQKFGFVPNVIEKMVAAPAAAQVYLQGQGLMAEASLKPVEQQAVALAVSAFNDCAYCSAAHRTAARSLGMAEADIQAIAGGGLPADDRLQALVRATRQILEKRGHLEEHDLAELKQVGVDRVQLYEIIALIGLKTITNYINHIEHTPIDPEFGG